jgi:hypothetical protein
MKTLAVLLCISMLPAFAGAQVAGRTEPSTTAAPQGIVSDLNPILGQLEQTAQALNLKLAKLRIEKWKADTGSKQQAQQNADSISRNLTSALPGMVAQVRANPQSLALDFKLYRNVSALYDVAASLTETAGAFGPKADYDSLASEVANLDNVRRAMGDKLENMAALTDTEITRLRTQIAQASAPPPEPPKKIVIDDAAEKPKKSAKKKKPAAATQGQSGVSKAQ